MQTTADKRNGAFGVITVSSRFEKLSTSCISELSFLTAQIRRLLILRTFINFTYLVDSLSLTLAGCGCTPTELYLGR